MRKTHEAALKAKVALKEREQLEDYFRFYNQERFHSSLGRKHPRKSTSSPSDGGTIDDNDEDVVK